MMLTVNKPNQFIYNDLHYTEYIWQVKSNLVLRTNKSTNLAKGFEITLYIVWKF